MPFISNLFHSIQQGAGNIAHQAERFVTNPQSPVFGYLSPSGQIAGNIVRNPNVFQTAMGALDTTSMLTNPLLRKWGIDPNAPKYQPKGFGQQALRFGGQTLTSTPLFAFGEGAAGLASKIPAVGKFAAAAPRAYKFASGIGKAAAGGAFSGIGNEANNAGDYFKNMGMNAAFSAPFGMIHPGLQLAKQGIEHAAPSVSQFAKSIGDMRMPGIHDNRGAVTPGAFAGGERGPAINKNANRDMGVLGRGNLPSSGIDPRFGNMQPKAPVQKPVNPVGDMGGFTMPDYGFTKKHFATPQRSTYIDMLVQRAAGAGNELRQIGEGLQKKVNTLLPDAADRMAEIHYAEHQHEPHVLQDIQKADSPITKGIINDATNKFGASKESVAKEAELIKERLASLQGPLERTLNPSDALKNATPQISKMYEQGGNIAKTHGLLSGEINPGIYDNMAYRGRKIVQAGSDMLKSGDDGMKSFFGHGQERKIPTLFESMLRGNTPLTQDTGSAVKEYYHGLAQSIPRADLVKQLEKHGLGEWVDTSALKGEIPKHGGEKRVPLGSVTKTVNDLKKMGTNGEKVTKEMTFIVDQDVADSTKGLFSKKSEKWDKLRIGKTNKYLPTKQIRDWQQLVKSKNFLGSVYHLGTESMRVGTAIVSNPISAIKTMGDFVSSKHFAVSKQAWTKVGVTYGSADNLDIMPWKDGPTTGKIQKLVDNIEKLPPVKVADSVNELVHKTTFGAAEFGKTFEANILLKKEIDSGRVNPKDTIKFHKTMQDIAKFVNHKYGGQNWAGENISKNVKTGMQMSLLAPDFNYGNFKLLSDGIAGIIKPIAQVFGKGEGANVNEREALKQTLINVALIGPTLTMAASLMLGKKLAPPTSKNPLAPFTMVYMGKDENGNDKEQNLFYRGLEGDIVNGINYSNQSGNPIAGIARVIANKMGPGFSAVAGVASNQQYNGAPITNPGDNPIQGVGKDLAYAATSGNILPIPFSLGNTASMFSHNADPGSSYKFGPMDFAGSFINGRAPSHVPGAPLQSLYDLSGGAAANTNPVKSANEKQLRMDFSNGLANAAEVNNVMGKPGEVNSFPLSSAQQQYMRANETPLQYSYSKGTESAKEAAYAQMSPQEKSSVTPPQNPNAVGDNPIQSFAKTVEGWFGGNKQNSKVDTSTKAPPALPWYLTSVSKTEGISQQTAIQKGKNGDWKPYIDGVTQQNKDINLNAKILENYISKNGGYGKISQQEIDSFVSKYRDAYAKNGGSQDSAIKAIDPTHYNTYQEATSPGGAINSLTKDDTLTQGYMPDEIKSRTFGSYTTAKDQYSALSQMIATSRKNGKLDTALFGDHLTAANHANQFGDWTPYMDFSLQQGIDNANNATGANVKLPTQFVDLLKKQVRAETEYNPGNAALVPYIMQKGIESYITNGGDYQKSIAALRPNLNPQQQGAYYQMILGSSGITGNQNFPTMFKDDLANKGLAPIHTYSNVKLPVLQPTSVNFQFPSSASATGTQQSANGQDMQSGATMSLANLSQSQDPQATLARAGQMPQQGLPPAAGAGQSAGSAASYPYADIIKSSGDKYGVPPEVIAAVIKQESSFNTNAVGDSGQSFGLRQYNMPSHPNLTPQQAEDPNFAIDSLAKDLGAAYHGDWAQAAIDAQRPANINNSYYNSIKSMLESGNVSGGGQTQPQSGGNVFASQSGTPRTNVMLAASSPTALDFSGGSTGSSTASPDLSGILGSLAGGGSTSTTKTAKIAKDKIPSFKAGKTINDFASGNKAKGLDFSKLKFAKSGKMETSGAVKASVNTAALKAALASGKKNVRAGKTTPKTSKAKGVSQRRTSK